MTATSQNLYKNITIKDCKLTKVMQNCINATSSISLIGCIDPANQNFEECLTTLQFADRTVNAEQVVKEKETEEENAAQNVEFPSEKMLKKKNDELYELKEKYDSITKVHIFEKGIIFLEDYKNKYQEIQKILGLTKDVEFLVARQNADGMPGFCFQ